MKAEELVALASAHGVDLVQAARLGASSTRQETVTHRRNGHRYQVLTAPSGFQVNGRASRSHERQAWTIAELGQAAAGVREIPFLAACYSYAGDTSAYWKLWGALARKAQELRDYNQWPARVKGASGLQIFYLEQLAQLVLDEDFHAHLFTTVPALYWICAGVDESTWRRGVFERFDQVKLRFLGWLGEAMSVMQPRLQEFADSGE